MRQLATRPRSSARGLVSKHRALYLLFVPVAVYYVLFVYIPIGGIVIAFKNYNFAQGMLASPWAGLTHFERFFRNGDFWKVFGNTLIINLLRIAFAFPAPIVFAVLLNEVRHVAFKRVVQTISYLPHFVSWVVISGLMFSFLSPGIGLVNNLIKAAGREPIFFLGDPRWFRPLLVASHIWRELGWSAIVYLAAIAGIDPELYEAGTIDGCNRRQLMFNVTIPSIRTVISVLFILTVGSIMNAGFEQVLVLINASVAEVGEIIDYYVYRVGLTQVNNYSYAAAVGLFKSAIATVLILLTNWLSKKIDEEGGLW